MTDTSRYRYVGLGMVACGPVLMLMPFFMPLSTEMAMPPMIEAVRLSLGVFLPVVGTYMYQRASDARWGRVVAYTLVALIPVIGPLVLLLHMVLLEAGVTARWALRAPVVLFAGTIVVILGFSAMEYVEESRRHESAIHTDRANLLLRSGSPRGINPNFLASQDFYRTSLAVEEAKQAIEVDPNSAYNQELLGCALYQHGSWDGAIAAYRAAVKLDDRNGTDSSFHQMQLALLLEKAGRVDEAIISYREAIRLKPEFDLAYVGLGDMLRRKGDLEGAKQADNDALRLMFTSRDRNDDRNFWRWSVSTACLSSERKAVNPTVEVSGSLFFIRNKDDKGKYSFVPTTEVPLIDGQSYGWAVTVRTNKDPIHFTEQVTLSGPGDWHMEGADYKISPDGKSATLTRKKVGHKGLISGSWTISGRDPEGKASTKVKIEGQVEQSFEFELKKPSR